MRIARNLSVVTAMALTLIALGCGDNQAQTGTAPPRLPPPGRPVVGEKPPMPMPVDVGNPSGYRVETLASGLEIPWDIAFASDKRVYVTERPGRVRLIEDGKLRPKPYAVIGSAAAGEGGLMGMALHPSYPNPAYVYLMYTYRSGGALYNRVSRFTDTGSGLTDEKTLVQGIRGHLYHDGGALRFGPDGMLYVGTGDAGQPELAQNKSSMSGKILRMTPGGGVPDGNPFEGSLVYAYGLRNVQGLAWNPSNGDLWATTHGPSGEFGLEAMDSVFIVPKGANCGWPRALGVTGIAGVTPPVLFFTGSSVPPALAAFYTADLMPDLKGNLFFASLAGEHLMRVVLSGPRKITRLERWFALGTHDGRHGRLRAVVQGPDGALYVSTSNRDGRARARPGDDRILRITPR